jgi:hypothetical protein
MATQRADHSIGLPHMLSRLSPADQTLLKPDGKLLAESGHLVKLGRGWFLSPETPLLDPQAPVEDDVPGWAAGLPTEQPSAVAY